MGTRFFHSGKIPQQLACIIRGQEEQRKTTQSVILCGAKTEMLESKKVI